MKERDVAIPRTTEASPPLPSPPGENPRTEVDGDPSGRATSSVDARELNGWTVAGRKHVFILSNAGKPIYSRHGDEQHLCGLMGLLQALVSVSLDSGDPLQYTSRRCVVAGDYRFVFLLKGALYFVMVTRGQEPHLAMRMQLERLYDRIIANLTGGIHKLYKAKPELDVRETLRGISRTFNELVKQMAIDPSYFLNAFPTLPMPPYIRGDLENVLQAYKPEAALFGLMVSNGRLVHYLRPSGHQLNPEDINMILSLSYCKSYSPYERWMPLCLPHFNSTGYLFAYIGYVMPSLCILFLSTEKDTKTFHRFSTARGLIKKALQRSHLYQGIGRCINAGDITLERMGLGNVHSVRHFLFRHTKYSQWTSLQLQMPYVSEEQQERLFIIYQDLYYRLERGRLEDDEQSGELNSMHSGGSPRGSTVNNGTAQMPNGGGKRLEKPRKATNSNNTKMDPTNGSNDSVQPNAGYLIAKRIGVAATGANALKVIWRASDMEAVLCIWSRPDFVLFVTIDPLASSSKVLPFYFSENVLQWIVREEESLFLDSTNNLWKAPLS